MSTIMVGSHQRKPGAVYPNFALREQNSRPINFFSPFAQRG